MRVRGQLPLEVAGRPVTITGGPFDAIPDGAFGVCLEMGAEKAWLADVAIPTPDFGLPDPARLREAVAALLALGLLATALAYALFFAILAGAGATNTMLVTLLVPVTALILGRFALDEALAPRHLLGMAVIGIGLLVIDGRVRRRLMAR